MHHHSSRHEPRRQPPPPPRRRLWCCPFTVPPRSPENPTTSHHHKTSHKSDIPNPKAVNSFPNSPLSSKLGLVGRILSPGRVSPIDSDPATVVDENIVDENIEQIIAPDSAHVPSRLRSMEKLPKLECLMSSGNDNSDEVNLGVYDVRLSLKGRNGVLLVLELNSEVLSGSSSVFADLIVDYRKGSNGSSSSLCRIEVPEVENLNVFRETIELMFEEDITKRLLKIGVNRSIDILEVSAGIMFSKGVSSCLNYLEGMPWREEEEEKLRSLFTKIKFDNATSRDILARLYSLHDDSEQEEDLQENSSTTLSRQLVLSITNSADTNARNELKPLVKGLLCRNYKNYSPDLNKEDIYNVCQSCINSLVSLFQEATTNGSTDFRIGRNKQKTPSLIERISKEVDNINWLLEILLDQQIAEEFVLMWASQNELLKMHGTASPMVRYELSRVSAILLIAIGTRKIHCRSDARLGLLEAWFGPMLSDFGWLRRCKKGLDLKLLEEAMGQTLLTLPLKHQYALFMEWFRYFSKYGTECPNISQSFQIWWRRSFLRSESESYAVESR